MHLIRPFSSLGWEISTSPLIRELDLELKFMRTFQKGPKSARRVFGESLNPSRIKTVASPLLGHIMPFNQIVSYQIATIIKNIQCIRDKSNVEHGRNRLLSAGVLAKIRKCTPLFARKLQLVALAFFSTGSKKFETQTNCKQIILNLVRINYRQHLFRPLGWEIPTPAYSPSGAKN